jgi:AbrB family looped-hinge helix DNA binding protein
MDRTKQKRRRGYTRLSSKGQITVPADVLRAAGLRQGDQLKVELDRAERIVLTPTESLGDRRRAAIERTAGSLRGVYAPRELDRLRDEWR